MLMLKRKSKCFAKFMGISVKPRISTYMGGAVRDVVESLILIKEVPIPKNL
jgi:hypothetical protein